MQFEKRDLTCGSEPVSASELEEGSIYFNVTYVDEDMLIPIMETLVFIGRKLDENDTESVCFQDVDSHRHGVRFDTATEDNPATFFSCTEDDLGAVFEYEQALEELMRCSLRRRGTQHPQ